MFRLNYWWVVLILLPLQLSNVKVTKTKGFALEEKRIYDVVTLTTYSVDPKQTDDTPTETASGFIIDSVNASKHRIIALSHDLKRKYRWGAKVRVVGAGRFNGVYVVRDLMNARWRNRVDILIDVDGRHATLRNVKLYPI